MKPMQVAVIGCGVIGNTHAEYYAKSPRAKLAYTVDIIPERARKTAEENGAPHAVEDYREALADPAVDAVSICLPNDLHCPVTLDALDAGKHVLCEKPIALNTSEAKRMRDKAKRKGLTLVIGVVFRFDDNVRFIRDAIRRGDLGTVYQVCVKFKNYRTIPGLGGWFTTKARAGGGVMIDRGVHFLDLTLFALDFPKLRTMSAAAHAVLGRNPRQYAYLRMWAGPPDYSGVCDVEEFGAGLIRTDGPDISFEGAWAQNVDEDASFVQFLGDKGGVHFDFWGDCQVYSNSKGVLYKTTPSRNPNDRFAAQIESFLTCATSGKPSPAGIDSVLGTQQMLDAFYRSAAEGREVKIPS